MHKESVAIGGLVRALAASVIGASAISIGRERKRRREKAGRCEMAAVAAPYAALLRRTASSCCVPSSQPLCRAGCGLLKY